MAGFLGRERVGGAKKTKWAFLGKKTVFFPLCPPLIAAAPSAQTLDVVHSAPRIAHESAAGCWHDSVTTSTASYW